MAPTGQVGSGLNGAMTEKYFTYENGVFLRLGPGLKCHVVSCRVGSEGSNNQRGSGAHPGAAAGPWRWPEIGQALE